MPPIPQLCVMRSRILSAIFAVATSAVTLRAQTAPSAVSALDTASILASARPEIDAANAAWLPGLRKHDAQAIAAAYSDSGMFVSASGKVTRGRAAVASMYAARFPTLREIRAGDVVQKGMAVIGPSRIVEWGEAWIEMAGTAPGAAPTRSGGAYLTIWEREADGHWRIVRNLTF
jgi:uncharacterized protein (TIGR02246 family)